MSKPRLAVAAVDMALLLVPVWLAAAVVAAVHTMAIWVVLPRQAELARLGRGTTEELAAAVLVALALAVVAVRVPLAGRAGRLSPLAAKAVLATS